MITWQANVGNDAVPSWLTIGVNEQIHFTGAGSTPSLARPVVRPDNGYVWPEECWIAPATYASGVQVVVWSKPSAVVQNAKVFKIIFAEALSAAPYLTAHDDADYDTWDVLVLAGTPQTAFKSLLKCRINGTEAAPAAPAAGWAVKETGSIGNANPNALKGDSSFCTVPFIPTIGSNFIFTIAPCVPYDAEAGNEGKYDPQLTIVYVHV